MQAIRSVTVVGITTASPTEIAYTEMANMYGDLEVAYISGASWVMSSKTRVSGFGSDAGTHPLIKLTMAAS